MLYSLYSEHRNLVFQQHTDLLLQHLRNEILRDLGSILNPDICIVAERGCNFKLFDGILQDYEIGLIVSREGRLLLEDKLAESYMMGNDLPGHYKYCVLSPYADLSLFRGKSHLMTEYKASSRVGGSIKRTFFDVVRFLDQSGCSSYRKDGLCFTKADGKNFTHIRAHFEILGSYEQTRYRLRSKIMEGVESLGRELKKIRQGRNLSSFMTEVVRKLLEQLTSLGVFRDKADLEVFPDLVPILFPFKMADSECSRPDCSQLITIGFDLRNAVNSHLGFLFDSKRVCSIVKTGGMYICTVIV